MKSIIVYYSHVGITAAVCHEFYDALSVKGHATLAELNYAKGRRNIFLRSLYSFFPLLIKLEPVVTDLKSFDNIIFGISVLGAEAPSPIKKYLSFCKHLKGKKIVCCYLYGIEKNAHACARKIRKILRREGAHTPIELFASWTEVQDVEFLKKLSESLIHKLS